MIETHPFGVFVPRGAKYLLLGSFTAKDAVGKNRNESYDWFYSNGRNKFWPILSQVYRLELNTKAHKQALLKALKIAIADIILSCDRIKNNSSDTSLKNIVPDTTAIREILDKNEIQKIFFSSRFVEKLFKRYFKDEVIRSPEIELITLPSPSPRFASVSFAQKCRIYKTLLPAGI